MIGLARNRRIAGAVLLAMLVMASPALVNAGSVTYTYDELGRVRTATYASGAVLTYTYDPAGNRTVYQVSCSSCTPIANPVSASVSQNSSANPITLNITGSAATSVAVASAPSHGSATASGTSMSYTPTSGYSGSDSFTYTAANSYGTSPAAAVSVTVTTGAASLVANPVSAAVAQNSTSNNIPLSISGGTPTYVTVSTAPLHGAAIATGITIAYTPTSGYSGSDSFAYTASNASGTSAPGTASITVNAAIADGTVLLSSSTPGSFSYTVPAGVSYVDIEGWGGGASGFNLFTALGGSGGGYFKKHISVSTGQVISGSIAAGNAGSGAATTVTSPALSAGDGWLCSNPGGTATGGDVNISGSPCSGTVGGSAGNGGGNQTTPNSPGTVPGGGGSANYGAGANGMIKITARTS